MRGCPIGQGVRLAWILARTPSLVASRLLGLLVRSRLSASPNFLANTRHTGRPRSIAM